MNLRGTIPRTPQYISIQGLTVPNKWCFGVSVGEDLLSLFPSALMSVSLLRPQAASTTHRFKKKAELPVLGPQVGLGPSRIA